jgi:predicted transcriptional regulator/DNA-binding XRE family transcriptional regulator
MPDQKIFAGPRIRRLRMERSLTQTAMAEGLGISPSYLNLIERNQRPLTVQLILKLASVYRIDPHELQGETRGSVAALKEVFSDPLLAGELPGDQELIDLAETAPNASAAMLKLFRAYREQAARLSDLNALLAGEGRATTLSTARLPVDEVREIFEHRPAYFAAIEDAAEAFAGEIDPGDDLFATLKAWLRREHGIAIKLLPVATMPNWRRRYDRHTQRLFLSERLSRADQLREAAMEACLIRLRDAIAAEIEALKLSTDEARRLARFELGRYAAHALMMPYAAFHQTAARARCDVAVLAARFGVSFEQAATRLITLQKTGSAGVPFFLMEIDGAGNRLRRAGAAGFPHAAFGGFCPKLPVHAAFAEPGRVLVEAVEMPEGSAFLCIARTVDGPQGGFGERPRRTALLLGCDISFREQTVYGAALPSSPAIPVGPACRLCERAGCLARAEPPVTRPLGLDEMATGLSAFDFQ